MGYTCPTPQNFILGQEGISLSPIASAPGGPGKILRPRAPRVFI